MKHFQSRKKSGTVYGMGMGMGAMSVKHLQSRKKSETGAMFVKHLHSRQKSETGAMFVKHLQSRQTSERTIHLHLEKTYIYTLTIEEEVWKNEVWNENCL